jgi:hypothetical protein
MMTETEETIDLSGLHVEGIADVDLRHYLDPLEETFQRMNVRAPEVEGTA